MARAPWGLVVLLAALTSAPAWADGEVLHEFVAGVKPDEAVAELARGQAAPDAIVQQGEVLRAPDAPAEGSPSMVATPGDSALGEAPGQRSPGFHPDRLTELEGTLDYHAAFNPSIAPFKRVSALDAVRLASDGLTPVLGIADPRTRPVRVEGADAAPPDRRARDRFFGEATLDFKTGARVPLPSVSPESRILSLRSAPAVALAIERDGADNFYAVYKDRRPSGEVFVSFLTDAPRAYFGAAIPQARVDALAAELPPLDPSIRARGRAFAAELGIGAGATLASALATLTAHFRAFEESAEPPPDTGDIYLDLARAKKGVCRHRAYAFVVTAQALGIPARFVQNEAHSWVEVKLPQVGFLRIDLGGAAHGLVAHNADDRPLYQPAQPDALPRPAAYEESYSLLGRNATGLRKPELAELQGRWVAPEASDPANAALASDASFLGGPSASAPRDTTQRAPLSIALSERQLTALRGSSLPLSGRIRNAEGAGVAGLRVEISLAVEQRRERLLLGVTVSDEQGEFAGSFDIPGDLAAGDYRLVVVTPGSESYLPAIAE